MAAALAAALVLPLAAAGSASADDNDNGDDDAVAIVSDGTILADDLANGDSVKVPVAGGTTVDAVGIALAGETDAALELGDVPVPEDTLLLVFAVTPQEELPFTDVEGSIHLEGIVALSEAGIVSGFEDDTFRPNASIRREQMATFLANALELVPTPTDPTFTDIENNVHEDNIRAIAEARITGGLGDGAFGPGQPVTRGQMSTFVARALGLIELTPES